MSPGDTFGPGRHRQGERDAHHGGSFPQGGVRDVRDPVLAEDTPGEAPFCQLAGRSGSAPLGEPCEHTRPLSSTGRAFQRSDEADSESAGHPGKGV